MRVGRYNELGEWKPIRYDGDPEIIKREVEKLTEEPKIRGILFYCQTTGFNCIEFVMKTHVDLPTEGIISIDNMLHIYKCPTLSDVQESIIYDCWLELSSLEVDVIESELQRIRLAINRIGITFHSPIEWGLKYNYNFSPSGKGNVTRQDLNFFNNILTASVNNNDLYLIEYAIDWYNQALRAKNIFTQYICYFTAIETLVTRIADGETEFHSGIAKLSKSDKIKCIENLEKEVRAKSILQFIQGSYENCIKSINRKFRIIFNDLLGDGHWSTKLFFEGDNSLINIRNKITHGEFSLYNKEHENIVKEHLHYMAELSREFILRLLLQKTKTDKLEDWGNLYSLTLSMTDPRSTLVCSSGMIFPTTDWRIRPEWCS